jgi:hypothetical protein
MKEREGEVHDDDGGQRGKVEGGVGTSTPDVHVSAERERRIEVARTAEPVEGGRMQDGSFRD